MARHPWIQYLIRIDAPSRLGRSLALSGASTYHSLASARRSTLFAVFMTGL
jgi:hypothetical protein